MSFLSALEISASGLRAQRVRMNVASSNLANLETTRTAAGGAYRRQQVALSSSPVGAEANRMPFERSFEDALKGVRVTEVSADMKKPMRMEFDPGHPDADLNGFVEKPNVDMLEEVVDMMTSSRSYEANATAFDTLKKMAQRALQIGT